MPAAIRAFLVAGCGQGSWPSGRSVPPAAGLFAAEALMPVLVKIGIVIAMIVTSDGGRQDCL